MHHPTDRITHTTAFVTPVVEHWLEREIAQWVHPMKNRSDDPSHHERTLNLWATSRSSCEENHCSHMRYYVFLTVKPLLNVLTGQLWTPAKLCIYGWLIALMQDRVKLLFSDLTTGTRMSNYARPNTHTYILLTMYWTHFIDGKYQHRNYFVRERKSKVK